MKNRLIFLTILLLMAVASIFYSFFKGSTFLTSHQLWDVVCGQKNPILYDILFLVRLPRVLGAFVTGGLLALSGVLMQLLLRNPLADPYVLGVSGGAAVATLMLLLFGMTGMLLIAGAWFGSVIVIFLIFIIAKRHHPWDTQRVLLTGIALASGCSAVISLILFLSDNESLRGMLFWLMGDLSHAHFPIVEASILLMGLMIALCLAGELNIALRGEIASKSLGVDIDRLQVLLYLLSSILTAAAVTFAGCVGFIGLIVPHILRLVGMRDHRFLLPSAVLLGGALLTVADTVARTVFSPIELPVGMIMALIGIPVFLFLLQNDKHFRNS